MSDMDEEEEMLLAVNIIPPMRPGMKSLDGMMEE